MLMFVDMQETHLSGKLQEAEMVCIAFPEGWRGAGKCGELKRWLCGMSPAANAWVQECAEKLGHAIACWHAQYSHERVD